MHFHCNQIFPYSLYSMKKIILKIMSLRLEKEFGFMFFTRFHKTLYIISQQLRTLSFTKYSFRFDNIFAINLWVYQWIHYIILNSNHITQIGTWFDLKQVHKHNVAFIHSLDIQEWKYPYLQATSDTTSLWQPFKVQVLCRVHHKDDIYCFHLLISWNPQLHLLLCNMKVP